MSQLRTFISALILSVVCFVVLSGCADGGTDGEPPPAGSVLHGFTPFPFDLTLEAIDRVHEIILPNSNLYAVHNDRCLPWHEALSDTPFPDWLVRDWDDTVARIPNTHTVYIAVTPTDQERTNLAPACGPEDENTTVDLPRRITRGEVR